MHGSEQQREVVLGLLGQHMAVPKGFFSNEDGFLVCRYGLQEGSIEKHICEGGGVGCGAVGKRCG